MTIDKKDLKILTLLEENSKLTTSKMAKKLNIPITTIHNRIKKLEGNGIITQYTIKLNHKKFGDPILAYILTSVDYEHKDKKFNQKELAKSVKIFEEVKEVNIMTGTTDLLIKVRVEDIESLNNFIINKLRNIDGIKNTETMISLCET